jgi:phage N-6-adenine-methyltransferase
MAKTTKRGNSLWAGGGPGFSSKTDLWATPQHVFDALHHEFRFDLDVCASPQNAKCPRFFTAAENGLAQEWTGSCWMNPPYGRGVLERWMKKAADSSAAGATVVALVAARTDTSWWHEQVMARAAELRLVRGRLKFGAGNAPAPFPSAVVVYRPGSDRIAVTTWTPPRALASERQGLTSMKLLTRPRVGECQANADKATSDRGSLRR